MISHNDINNSDLLRKIKNKQLVFAGNKKLKIYGTLSCTSGKSMKKQNQVFFSSELEAMGNGYRPCGHCMKEKYEGWKKVIS